MTTGSGRGAVALPKTPDDVRLALEGQGYLADDGLATAIFLAMVLHRPLFLEGEPGGGKTEVANALARVDRRGVGPPPVLRRN